MLRPSLPKRPDRDPLITSHESPVTNHQSPKHCPFVQVTTAQPYRPPFLPVPFSGVNVASQSYSRGAHNDMAISIDDLLRRAVENKASDLHLKVGNHPYLRVDGLLAPITDVPRITPEEMLSMAFSMMTNRQKQ